MSKLLDRYLKGEYTEVWNELRAAPPSDETVLADAQAVAIETMHRVARNADRLVKRLSSVGWQALFGELRSAPNAKDEAIIARIEQYTCAPVPMSLAVFWRVVGGVDFVWNYKKGEAPSLIGELQLDDFDPLSVNPARMMGWAVEEWEGSPSRIAERYRVPLAPDYAHKINVSGGEPYGIEVPCHDIDPIFHDDQHSLPFVDYLRLCMRWAGFPLLVRVSSRRDVQEFVAEWTSDLEPF